MTQYSQPGASPTGTGGVQPVQQPGQPAPGASFYDAATAQGAAGTANINQQTIANRANQINPTGSSTWSQDPATGQWTNTQTQSAGGQALTDAATGMVPGALDAFGKPIDSSNFSQLYSFGAPGQVNQQAQDAVMSRLDPMMQQRRAQMETQLANQGITRGSEAWQNAENQMGRDENDARMQGIQAGFTQGNLQNQQDINYGNYQSQQRAGQFGEARDVRNQGINDINTVFGSKLNTNPTFGQYGQAGVAAAPNYLGAGQSTYNALLDSQNADADSKASLYKGLFGLGGSFLGSDIGQKLIGKGGDYLSNLFGFGDSKSTIPTAPSRNWDDILFGTGGSGD